MAWDRSEIMQRRSGVLGWFDRIRYREIYRQSIGLLLILVCAIAAEPGHGRVLAGFAMAAAGQAFRIFAAGTIFKNRQLATSGAYALVRHPLYLGNILILGGFVLASANLWVALAVLVFFLVWYPAAVAYEDGKLERLFEDEWRDWRARTGAVFPRGVDWRGLAAARWQARQSLLRNGELPITIYLLACGAWLWFRSHS
jgi:protein-S-isoprenylcysteine O-methyltransferase Ste14